MSWWGSHEVKYFFLSSFGSHLVLIWFHEWSSSTPASFESQSPGPKWFQEEARLTWGAQAKKKKNKLPLLPLPPLPLMSSIWKRLVTFGFAVSCCIAKVPPRHCTSCVTLWSKHPPCLRLALHCHEEEWRAAWSQRISPVGACWRAVKPECVSNLKCFIVYQ